MYGLVFRLGLVPGRGGFKGFSSFSIRAAFIMPLCILRDAMSLLNQLEQPSVWELFYQYKMSKVNHRFYEKQLRAFIDKQRYLPVCQAIREGKRFALPRRAVISKMSTGKKRIVYIYPEPENTVLKLLTWLLLRRYDGLFSPSLFSFRPHLTAKDAVRRFLHMSGISTLYAYKADIHDYHQSWLTERSHPYQDTLPTHQFPHAMSFLRIQNIQSQDVKYQDYK